MIKQIGVYNGSQWDLQNIGASAENIILPNSQLGAATLNELLGKLLPSQEFTPNRVLLTGSDRKMIASQVNKSNLQCLIGCQDNIQDALDAITGSSNPFLSKTMLENGTNLNNVKTAGNYYSYNSDSTATMSNVPVAGSGFNLLVFSYPNNTNNPTIQVFWRNNNTSYVMFRICNHSGLWGEWRSLATTNDLSSYLTKATADSLYATQAALGSYYTKTQVDSKITSINSTTSNLQTQITTNKNNLSSLTTRFAQLGTGTGKGTSKYDTTKVHAVNASTLYNGYTLAVPAGRWIVEARAAFQSSGDASYRSIHIASSATSEGNSVQVGAAIAGNTSIYTHMIYSNTNASTLYMNFRVGKACNYVPSSSGIWATKIYNY